MKEQGVGVEYRFDFVFYVFYVSITLRDLFLCSLDVRTPDSQFFTQWKDFSCELVMNEWFLINTQVCLVGI